jgi:hypothetical protein
MYIVRRQSRSGGAEYLLQATTKKGYRWGKVCAEQVHVFSNSSTARRNAKKYGGNMHRVD